MAPFPTNVKELCTPASLYFFISIFSLAIILLQNLGNNNSYTMGSFSCRVPSTTSVFIIKLIYILFWTWVLNLICRAGAPGIAWFLVLLPFILMFVLISMLFISG